VDVWRACCGCAVAGVMVCERVFRGDVRVGVVVGEGRDLDCGDAERREDMRLDSRREGV
jgi:hypothetical protein